MDRDRYQSISFDADVSWRRTALQGRPWRFINLLPFRVQVFIYREARLEFVGEIQPHKILVTARTQSGLHLKKGDRIHILYPDRSSVPPTMKDEAPQYQILRSVDLFDDSREVRIGDVVYNDRDTSTKDIHHDIIGIRVHNHTTFPLEVFYQGKHIGSTAGDDGTSFMSGSPNSVYLNNDRFGFELGSTMSFAFRDGCRSIPYASVVLIDNYISDINVGVITQKFVAGRGNDIFSYRIDEPVITGEPRFETVTGYTVREM